MPEAINDGLTNQQRYHAKPEKKAMRSEKGKGGDKPIKVSLREIKIIGYHTV